MYLRSCHRLKGKLIWSVSVDQDDHQLFTKPSKVISYAFTKLAVADHFNDQITLVDSESGRSSLKHDEWYNR